MFVFFKSQSHYADIDDGYGCAGREFPPITADDDYYYMNKVEFAKNHITPFTPSIRVSLIKYAGADPGSLHWGFQLPNGESILPFCPHLFQNSPRK